MLKTITLLIFFLKCTVFFSQNKIESPLDSVNKYYSISETILIPENRVKFLNKAFFYAKKLPAKFKNIFFKIKFVLYTKSSLVPIVILNCLTTTAHCHCLLPLKITPYPSQNSI